MPLLGAHMSIAGGYYKAADAAGALGMATCQLFTKNNTQWKSKAISPEDVGLFRAAIERNHLVHPLSHSSYLLNLASPNEALWQQSVDALVVEVERAGQLAIDWVVLHPGAFTTGSEENGLALVARGLTEALERTAKCPSGILLENTAGQGSTLGWKFEHLGTLIEQTGRPKRLGVCIDTCHAFAAGYPLAARKDYLATMRALNGAVGLEQVKALHLNDSKRELGSRVDRHEHIGRGKLGLEPFRHVMNDRRWNKVPKYLETPKGLEKGEELDAINLRTLRGLVE